MRSLPEHPIESEHDAGSLFYFRDFGPLDSEPSHSPLVNLFVPVQKRGVLTTIGEVHFLATPLSAFPGLNKLNKRFRKWLNAHPCVFSHRPDFVHEWDNFLEGSACNWDPDIFALPDGMEALRRGEYFIAHYDLNHTLDLVCRKLELRGVTGIEPI
jgi:hypothetical protein